MLKINLNTIIETTIPLLVLALISAMAKIVYDNKKNIAICFKRLRLTILPIKYNLLLSLDFNEGLNSGNYFKEIHKNLQQQIDSAGLSKNIKILDCSDIIKFKTKGEAESFRNKKNVDLIIWGGFTGDNLKTAGKNINKVNLFFTFGHPQDKEKKLRSMIILDLSGKFALKNYWNIVEDNSLHDIGIVSSELFDLSTYMLALSLKIFGHIKKSADLFEVLYGELVKRNDALRNHIVPHLINCYELLLFEILFVTRDFNKGKYLCNKILSFNKDSFFALSNLAYFEYKIGNTLASENIVCDLLKKYPNNPLVEVDIAFFRIKQKKFTNAFRHYERLSKYQVLNFNANEVIEFLYIEYEATKEPSLLYGSGIISYYFGDVELAYKDLTTFLSKANEIDYKQMYRNAKNLLLQKESANNS